MGNKIAPIKKQYSNAINTIDQQLDKHGYTRFPGTSETVLPYKELSGKYRTGLDPSAPYLQRLSEEDKAAEIKRITETKERLEGILGIPGILNPTSLFWNFAAPSQALIQKFGSELRVSPVKLGNNEEYFDLNDVMGEITWSWLSVHPRIAGSLDAYKRGEVSADTKYYIVDDSKEAKETFDRKREINKAVIAFDEMTPTKRKQLARLMGLPVTESTTEEVVYNLVDSLLKETEFKEGEFKGLAPVRLFSDLIKTTDERIHVKDLVKQALTHQIYRQGIGDKIMEGGLTIAISKEELIENLLKDENQMDLIALETKLKSKKIESL